MTIDTDDKKNKFPEYESHPLANSLPLMSSDKLWQLAKDISKNGLFRPIILFEGKILDGRNRYKACRMVNETPRFEEFDESCDPFDFVESMNLHIRELNSAQKAEFALAKLEYEREKGLELMSLGGKQKGLCSEHKPLKDPHDSRLKAAKRVGISDKTLWQWEKITDAALEDEGIEIARVKALAGDRSIVSVINDIRGKEREQELLEIAKRPKKISGTIIHGDFFEKIKKVKDDSIDLLFVDPPYNVLKEDWDTFESLKAYREFCQEWLSLVMPKVKDTGRVYICSSQKHKYKFYSVLQTNLFFGFNFGQEIIWHYKNNMRISNDNEYHYVYDPIFYLYGKKAVKLNFPHEAFKDGIMTNVWTIAIPQNNFSEGKFHKTQKPLELLRRIILTGSQEDDLILDPFAGSGTTGVVCEELQRKYILIEKDPKQIEIAKGRIKGSVSE